MIDSRDPLSRGFHDMLRRIAPFVLIALSALVACEREQELPPETIAVVGNRTVSLDDFKRYLRRNPATELVQLSPEAASALLDQHIEEILLSEHAADLDLLVPADRVAEAVRNDPGSTVVEKRDELQRNLLLSRLSDQTEPPAEQDVRRYYDENLEQFELGERVRVRQILLKDQETAAEVHAALRNGAPFEEMARKHSLAPNAGKGGEIGEISRGDLPGFIEREVFDLKSGAISDVIEAAGTFHLFKVEDRLPAETLSFDAVRPVIASRLRSDRIAEALSRETSRARSAIRVRVLSRRLPFTYSGAYSTSPAE